MNISKRLAFIAFLPAVAALLLLAFQYWRDRSGSRERAFANQFASWQASLASEADALPLDFRQPEPTRAIDRVWKICRKADDISEKLAAASLRMPHAAREFRNVRDRLEGACALKTTLMEQESQQQRKDVESDFLLKLTQSISAFDRAREALRTDPAGAADSERFSHGRDLVALGLASAFTAMVLLLAAKPGAGPAAQLKPRRAQGFDAKAALTTDSGFRILSVSSATEDLLRRTSAELVGKPLSAVFPGISGEKVDRWKSVGRAQTVRETIRNADGASFLVDLELHPNGDAFGTWILFIAPLTPGSRPEHESDAFRQAAAPMIVLDADAQIVAMNLAAEEMTEFAAAELRACAYWDMFVDEADRGQAVDDFRSISRGPGALWTEQTWVSRTGKRERIRLVVSPVRDSANHLRNVVLCCMQRGDAPPGDWRGPVIDLQNHLTVMRGYLDLVLPTVHAGSVLYEDLAEAKSAAESAWKAASLLFPSIEIAPEPSVEGLDTGPRYQSH